MIDAQRIANQYTHQIRKRANKPNVLNSLLHCDYYWQHCVIQWQPSCLFNRFAYICIPYFHIYIYICIECVCVCLLRGQPLCIERRGEEKQEIANKKHHADRYFRNHWFGLSDRTSFRTFAAIFHWTRQCSQLKDILRSLSYPFIEYLVCTRINANVCMCGCTVCCSLILYGLTTS